ncbi:hypothetical protein FBQ99_11610 [Chloroflexi bacterium CFX2]|nr:hypothetical protein [Chloroflexi bacterium CFX2]
MLLLTTLLKRILIISFMILIVVLLTACGIAAPAPTAAATRAPSRTPITPSFTRTSTPSPIISTATPDFCKLVHSQDKIKVISDDLLTTFGPGNPVVFDRILTEHDPAWADFHQMVHGELRSAGVIFHETSAGPELGTALNPAVILVIYGMEWNWQLPTSGDLNSEVEHIRAVLFQHRSDWIHGQVDQSQYPVANAATYALYVFFDHDTSRLQSWCNTYKQLFGTSPLSR